MVFLSNKFRNHKEIQMDTTTPKPITPDMVAMRDHEILSRRFENAKAQLDSIRSIIENLPWEDINTGDFSPEAGCTTVAEVRDSLISLGCDSDLLNKGICKAYKVYVTVPVEMTVYVESATDEEDAEEKASDILSNVSIFSRSEDVEVSEVNSYEVHFDSTEETY